MKTTSEKMEFLDISCCLETDGLLDPVNSYGVPRCDTSGANPKFGGWSAETALASQQSFHHDLPA